jgi:3-hydroxybutyryl-CoA dehydrogenase
MEIKNVGIVGGGIMGSGLTQVCAQSGYNTMVLEVNDELVNKAIKSIDSALGRLTSKGKITEKDKESIMSRIKGTTDIGDFSNCDFVIEAVTEDLPLKKDIFSQLDKICPKHAILASNTSVLSVSAIASATGRVEQVLGMHFSNPVPVQKIVEVINTVATSKETTSTAVRFSESIGKTVVITKDLPGFISNRVFTPFLLNAVRLVQEGIATPEDIDTVFRLGGGHAMGPLETLDLIGIDTVFRGASAIYEELKDPQYAPPPLMRRMVEMGWFGRKTGKGFYNY